MTLPPKSLSRTPKLTLAGPGLDTELGPIRLAVTNTQDTTLNLMDVSLTDGNEGGNGVDALSAAVTGWYGQGEALTVTATPEPGFLFTGWTASGIPLTPAQKAMRTLDFTMPANCVTLTAGFAPVPPETHTITAPDTPGNIVLVGHNYGADAQFGRLDELEAGDAVELTA